MEQATVLGDDRQPSADPLGDRDGLLRKTSPNTKSHYREDELRAVLRVCTVCGHHFPVGAEERVEQLADPGSFRRLADDLRSADPLAFTDLRPLHGAAERGRGRNRPR